MSEGILTKREFTRSFEAAKRGSWVWYYWGFLWADRQVNRDLDKTAREAWQRFKDGEATLVQKRYGAGCHYYAVKL